MADELDLSEKLQKLAEAADRIHDDFESQRNPRREEERKPDNRTFFAVSGSLLGALILAVGTIFHLGELHSNDQNRIEKIELSRSEDKKANDERFSRLEQRFEHYEARVWTLQDMRQYRAQSVLMNKGLNLPNVDDISRDANK